LYSGVRETRGGPSRCLDRRARAGVDCACAGGDLHRAADELHLTPQPLPSADAQLLASTLAALKPHDRALVVGHSNTVPEILRALKITTPVTIGDAEYDNLFIVVPQKDSAPVLLRLKF
jgi:phosphohistidine phosphatase SixA